MAPAISSTRELAIASRKRPSSPTSSESDPLADLSESPSDFETPIKPARKPARKKTRITEIATPLVKGGVIQKIPKEYQSEEGNPLFGTKWYKEVTKRDGFWGDFKKKVPKSIWQKRFKVEAMINLNEDGVNGARGGENTVVAVGKTRKIAIARKKRNPDKSTLSMDLVSGPDVAEDAPIASIEAVNDEYGQTQAEDSIMLSGDIRLDEEAAESFPKSTSTGVVTAPKENDDLISRALADPNTTLEQRTAYIAIREQQERTAKAIEIDIEENSRREENRLIRAEAKERKAAKDADAETGETENQALDANENGSKEKQRKTFNPTRF